MVLYSFMNKIAPEPHAWSTSPATSLKNYLKRYGSVYSEQEEVTPTTAPVGSCGNGVCEEGETVSNCPADCKSYPGTDLPAPSCSGLSNGVHCYPSNCCSRYFTCLNNRPPTRCVTTGARSARRTVGVRTCPVRARLPRPVVMACVPCMRVAAVVPRTVARVGPL